MVSQCPPPSIFKYLANVQEPPSLWITLTNHAEQLIHPHGVNKDSDIFCAAPSNRSQRVFPGQLEYQIPGQRFFLTVASRATNLLFLHKASPSRYPVRDVLPETAPAERHHQGNEEGIPGTA